MNKRLFLVYFVGFLLLFCSSKGEPGPYKRAEGSRLLTIDRFQKIKSSYQAPKLAGLLNAFISGEKRYIPRKIKKKFEIIGLSHLFTPSGVHLSSLYFLLIPLFKLVQHRILIFLPLMAFSYFFTPFHSIKRILLMRTTKEWLQVNDLFYVFLITFIWDFFFGTYSLSPLSFSYSFLFLGIIISFINSPKIYLPLALFGGQIIAQFFSNGLLSTTGFVWNFLLTSIFGLLYPFFFISYWFPQFTLLEKLLSIFYDLVSYCGDISFYLGTFMPTFNFVLVCFYLSVGGRKIIILALLILFSSQPLFNSEVFNIKKKSHLRKPYQHIQRTRKGYTSWHTDRVCRHRHKPSGMFIKCSYD